MSNLLLLPGHCFFTKGTFSDPQLLRKKTNQIPAPAKYPPVKQSSSKNAIIILKPSLPPLPVVSFLLAEEVCASGEYYIGAVKFQLPLL